MERFDSFDPNYKAVEDIPAEHKKDEYVHVSDVAFVEKSAVEFQEEAARTATNHNKKRPFVDKVLFKNSKSTMDVLHEDALGENRARESSTFSYQQDFREIFGQWPEVRRYTKTDKNNKVTYSDAQIFDRYKKFLDYLQEQYRANKEDKEAKILYGMEIAAFFTGHSIDPIEFFGIERFTESWKYKDKLFDLRKSFAS